MGTTSKVKPYLLNIMPAGLVGLQLLVIFFCMEFETMVHDDVHHLLPEPLEVQLEPGNLLLDDGAGNDPTGSYMFLLAQSLARVHLRI